MRSSSDQPSKAVTVSQRHDVLILGGGVMGCATAYFLTREAPSASVAVIERDTSYTRASSALSVSSIRQQFSTPTSIAMSRYGFEFLLGTGTELGVDLGLIQRGYLILAEPAAIRAQGERVQLQRACGANVELLDPSELERRYPWLNVKGVGGASYGASGEGWFDGPALHQAFRRRARARGVAFLRGEVATLAHTANRITRVELSDGTRLSADVYVNACGPWAADIMPAGLPALPIVPRKRQVFVIRTEHQVVNMPMVMDPSGIWCRPEGAGYICGKAPDAANDPDGAPLEVEHAQFESEIWPRLAHRIPAFQALKVTTAWAGYYEYCTFDQNAVIGAIPGASNLLVLSGFSGHGLQHAPAGGRGIAEIIVHGRYRTLDLSPLGYQRLLDDAPMVEANVY